MDGGPAPITSFAEVQAWLEQHGTTLGAIEIQPGAATLRRPRAAIGVVEVGARPAAACDVVVLVGTDGWETALAELRAERVQLLPIPCTAAVLERTIGDAIAAAEAHAQARVADQLLEIGLALNAERDAGRVLELILEHARSITSADAGSIYLVEEGGESLLFKIAKNDSVDADFSEFSLPVTSSSIVGAACLTGTTRRIADLYADEVAHDRSFDERFGYQTHSMITTPMITPDGTVLAVIQLINAKTGTEPLRTAEDFNNRVVPFTQQDEHLCEALAAQAAVALENSRLIAEIQALFEGFVRASVHAIEQRDPTTSGHSQRVADLTVGLARAADRASDGRFAPIAFDREQLREIEYAGLLHDFGKVGVREEVLVKAKKLYDHQLELVLSRFDHMRTSLLLDLLAEQLERARSGRPLDDKALEATYARRLTNLEGMITLVHEANEPSVLPAEASARLEELAELAFRNTADAQIRPVGAPEIQALTIPRGSLTHDERLQIQDHVTHTYNFLVRIPWGRNLKDVPDIAGKHHEYLDGTGYPKRVSEPAIPLQTRMMTVSDIFDALAASDRPYKKAVPVPKALDILHDEARAGKLDTAVLDLFIEAKVFEGLGKGRWVRP